jgi:hypothetical protein
MMSPKKAINGLGNTTMDFFKGGQLTTSPSPVHLKKIHYNHNGTGRDTYIM